MHSRLTQAGALNLHVGLRPNFVETKLAREATPACDFFAALASVEREFAAEHFVHEAYQYRNDDPDMLSTDERLEQLVGLFQRLSVEFRRLNPQYRLMENWGTRSRFVFPTLGLRLTWLLAARGLADHAMEQDRTELIRALVPVALSNPTALDTALSYLLIATKSDDSDLLDEIVAEVGPVAFADVAVSAAQIWPDAPIPT